jgi:cell division protein FtsQ
MSRRARRPVRRPARRRRPRRRPGPVAVALTALVVVGAGLLWFRDSSLVAVREVKVTGMHGRSAADIRGALRQEATTMTVLHASRDDLRRAVARFPSVKDVEVSSDFPHKLIIRVIEHNAVGYVAVDGRRVPVAANGKLLRDARVDSDLPPVSGRATFRDDRLTDRQTLDEVALLGAAPRVLRPLVTDVRRDGYGLHVGLRDGPRLDFGRGSRLRAKWIAAERVLGDPRAAGASYLDLRVPERPIAGSFPGDVAAAGDAQEASNT